MVDAETRLEALRPYLEATDEAEEAKVWAAAAVADRNLREAVRIVLEGDMPRPQGGRVQVDPDMPKDEVHLKVGGSTVILKNVGSGDGT